MTSLKILCLVLVGLSVVQAQVETAPAVIAAESAQSEPSAMSGYDQLVERFKKLIDRGEARVRGVLGKMNEASGKVQQKISELNVQTDVTGQEIMKEARIGASKVYDGVSGVVSEMGASGLSVLATTAVGAYRLGNEITQGEQPVDRTQEVIDLLENE